MRRETRLQHLGEDPRSHLGAAVPPVFRTSLFSAQDSDALEAAFQGRGGYLYSRSANPTVRLLEEKVADLEGAAEALACASGMGAISAVLLAHLRTGDHLLISSRAYGPTLAFARHLKEALGVEVTRVEPQETERLAELLGPRTRLVYMESPASLTFEVVDLAEVARAARERGVLTVADNSWATPLFQQPLAAGIDLVVHSGTKYLSGHSDLLLGIAAGSREAMQPVRRLAGLLGATLSPADAFLAVRGIRTLPLRMERHQRSALLIAHRLLEHPRVRRVLHPALCFFPSHHLFQKQFRGASGLFSFELDGDARRFCDALELFRLGVSWGGHESLALPVAVAPEARRPGGSRPDLPEALIRLSIGLEDPEDLWQDLERGFAASSRP